MCNFTYKDKIPNTKQTHNTTNKAKAFFQIPLNLTVSSQFRLK